MNIDSANAVAVSTKDQRMTISVNLQMYQLLKFYQSEIHDYYLIAGSFFPTSSILRTNCQRIGCRLDITPVT